MKATDQIKRAAFNKTIDYLLENPERNVAKIMDMIDRVAPTTCSPPNAPPSIRQSMTNRIGINLS